MSRVTIEFGQTAYEQDGASVGIILNALARLRVSVHPTIVFGCFTNFGYKFLCVKDEMASIPSSRKFGATAFEQDGASVGGVLKDLPRPTHENANVPRAPPGTNVFERMYTLRPPRPRPPPAC